MGMRLYLIDDEGIWHGGDGEVVFDPLFRVFLKKHVLEVGPLLDQLLDSLQISLSQCQGTSDELHFRMLNSFIIETVESCRAAGAASVPLSSVSD